PPERFPGERRIDAPSAHSDEDQRDKNRRSRVPIGKVEGIRKVKKNVGKKTANSQYDQAVAHESDGGDRVDGDPYDEIYDEMVAAKDLWKSVKGDKERRRQPGVTHENAQYHESEKE